MRKGVEMVRTLKERLKNSEIVCVVVQFPEDSFNPQENTNRMEGSVILRVSDSPAKYVLTGGS